MEFYWNNGIEEVEEICEQILGEQEIQYNDEKEIFKNILILKYVPKHLISLL